MEISFPVYSNLNWESSSEIGTTPEEKNDWYRGQAENDLLMWNVWSVIDPSIAWTAAHDSVRFYNPDIQIYGYIAIHHINDDAVSGTTILKAIYDETEAGDYWMHNTLGDPFQNSGFASKPTGRTSTQAEILTRNYLDAVYEGGVMDHDWTGFFMDFVDYPDIDGWWCPTNCWDYADLDNNGDTYRTDQVVEQAMQVAFWDSILTQLDRGMTASGKKLLISANGPAASHSDIANRVDMIIIEDFTELKAKDTTYWEDRLNNYRKRLKTDRMDYPMLFFIDTTINLNAFRYEVMESLSMVGLCTGQVYSPGTLGNGSNYYSPGDKLTHDFGNPIGDAVIGDQGDGWAIATRQFENGSAGLRIPIDGALYHPLTSDWWYLIVTADADTLRRSTNWPRQEE